MQIIRTFLIGLCVLGISVGAASAQEVNVKGKATTKFEGGLFSSSPSAEMKSKTIEAAKIAAWKRYTAAFNAAKQRSYKAMEPEFLSALDEYILDYSIVDEFTDESSSSYTVVLRLSVNGAAVDSKMSANSAAGAQMGEGSTFAFIFLAREAASRTSFQAKETNISTAEALLKSQESIANSGGTTVSGTQAKSQQKTVTGGSTVRKADKVEYRATSSSDINAKISEQLTVAGFEVVDYGDVVSECGGAEPDAIKAEFSVADAMSRKTRKMAITGARECDVSFFAVGTLDVGVNDVDPVSGLERVYVSVRGQVWNIAKRLPKKVASVGPVQFSGTGPDAGVARGNALRLAGQKAGSIIVDQMNMKNLR